MKSLPHQPSPSAMVKILSPFQAFAQNKVSGGVLLLVCTIVALVWANSAWAQSYADFWHTRVEVGVAGFAIRQDLHFWVNDLLMAVFFLRVGLEIKREMLVGELASPRQAALPIAAAFGGVAVPALIYALMNHGGQGAPGWGIPMATDIAFALGVLALLGDRVPVSLKVFLAALAIVDDIAAVLVIAAFYTASISWTALGIAALIFALLFAANRTGVRHALPYAVLGVCLWIAVLQSGIHPTIAGVALAFAIPCRTVLNSSEFLGRSRAVLDYFERASMRDKDLMINDDLHAAIDELEATCERVQPPLYRIENALHSWVTFLVMPLFALANAGLVLPAGLVRQFSEPVTLGVVLGLLIGKPIGVTLGSWLAVRTGFIALPEGITWSHIHGAAWLAGIGFTMSLFIAGLAFSQDSLLGMAKIGVLAASTFAGLIGSAILFRARRVEH
ncbi:MAG: Na+/H+ antiporter NhaA [Acidobacteriota bacterium]